MEIDVTTPALLFPTISLLLLAYTNRFLGIAQLIRKLNRSIDDHNRALIQSQVKNLRQRVRPIISMQATGVASLILCTVSMMSHFIDAGSLGLVSFGLSLAIMLLSLGLSLVEITISGNALNIELGDIDSSRA